MLSELLKLNVTMLKPVEAMLGMIEGSCMGTDDIRAEGIRLKIMDARSSLVTVRHTLERCIVTAQDIEQGR